MTTPNIVAMVPRTVAYEVPNQADLLTEGEAAVNSANFMGVAIATEADCAADPAVRGEDLPHHRQFPTAAHDDL